MSRRVTMFQPRFAPLVQSRAKRQTIRPLGKRPARVGQIMDARQWSGKPYRSPTIKLIESPIIKADVILISETAIHIGSQEQPNSVCETLARRDGFSSLADFRQFFRETYSLPFEGQLIQWQ